jgi:hypothetical protein
MKYPEPATLIKQAPGRIATAAARWRSALPKHPFKDRQHKSRRDDQEQQPHDNAKLLHAMILPDGAPGAESEVNRRGREIDSA